MCFFIYYLRKFVKQFEEFLDRLHQLNDSAA